MEVPEVLLSGDQRTHRRVATRRGPPDHEGTTARSSPESSGRIGLTTPRETGHETRTKAMHKHDHIEKKHLRKDPLPKFTIGDTVDVLGESSKVTRNASRFQRHGDRDARSRSRRNLTVRRIVQDESVERIFPVNSPKIAGLKVKRSGKVRRAKLTYLRKRTGKATRLVERMNTTPTPPG
jgi:large subunit ribosomal protein L19